MKRLSKITSIIATVLLTTAILNVNAYAAEATLNADKTSCENGEIVNVEISVTAEGEMASPPDINIEYNPARLQFDNCSVEYGGGGGGLITINDTDAVITFTTLSGGDASVKLNAIVGEETCEGEVTISVAGEDTVGSEEEAAAGSEYGVEFASIPTGTGRVVQTVFPDEYLPKLFEKNVTTYQGQQAECARFDMGDMVLLLTTDEAGTDARFMRYNEATGELTDYRMIEGIENRFIIILNEWEGEIPNGYIKSVLDWNGQMLTAFKSQEADAGTATCFAGINPNDFFLVYALSSEGTKGWYQYDLNEGTYQRFVQYVSADGSTMAEGGLGESTSGDDETFLDEFISGQVQMILLFVFFGISFILLIIVIILGVKVSDYDDYEYMDPDEYMRMQEQTKKNNVAKNNKKAAEIVKKTMNGDEEDEEEDEEEEEETVKKPSKKKSSVKKAEPVKEDEEEDEDEEDENLEEDSEEEESEAEEDEGEEDEEDEADDEVEDDEEDDDDEDDEEEDEEDIDEYFAPRMTRKEAKAYEKQLKREEKLAAKEEKWKAKEEKKAAKMRARGIEETSPMDWESFGESLEAKEDTRRPVGKKGMPAYMQNEDIEEEEEVVVKKSKSSTKIKEDKLPARKNPPMSMQREAESAKEKKEDELRKKQQRLFEQQRRIEEQRRIEQEQYEEEQRVAQENFVKKQHMDEDLDEDFQFEFIDL